jgi:hypothetical protein
MKTLFSASIQLTGTGGLCTALGRCSDDPSFRALAPIGYLLLSAGLLLMVVVALACASARWEAPCSEEGPD